MSDIQCVGQRIKIDHNLGTIRFVGSGISKANPKAVFLGVEWDDLTRGKHNGTIDGTTFFTLPTNSSSFVHAKKAEKAKSFGRALLTKYLEIQTDLTDDNFDMIMNNSPSAQQDGEAMHAQSKSLGDPISRDTLISSTQGTFYEIVGMNRARSHFQAISRLQALDLGNANVGYIVSPIELTIHHCHHKYNTIPHPQLSSSQLPLIHPDTSGQEQAPPQATLSLSPVTGHSILSKYPRLLGNIHTLGLSHSNLICICQLAYICSVFPSLRSIDVSNNPLQLDPFFHGHHNLSSTNQPLAPPSVNDHQHVCSCSSYHHLLPCLTNIQPPRADSNSIHHPADTVDSSSDLCSKPKLTHLSVDHPCYHAFIAFSYMPQLPTIPAFPWLSFIYHDDSQCQHHDIIGSMHNQSHQDQDTHQEEQTKGTSFPRCIGFVTSNLRHLAINNIPTDYLIKLYHQYDACNLFPKGDDIDERVNLHSSPSASSLPAKNNFFFGYNTPWHWILLLASKGALPMLYSLEMADCGLSSLAPMILDQHAIEASSQLSLSSSSPPLPSGYLSILPVSERSYIPPFSSLSPSSADDMGATLSKEEETHEISLKNNNRYLNRVEYLWLHQANHNLHRLTDSYDMAMLFPRLHRLNLHKNRLTWQSMRLLATLPQLEFLNISHNEITTLEHPALSTRFPALTHLYIDDNHISTYHDVYLLSKLCPTLQNFSISVSFGDQEQEDSTIKPGIGVNEEIKDIISPFATVNSNIFPNHAIPSTSSLTTFESSSAFIPQLVTLPPTMHHRDLCRRWESFNTQHLWRSEDYLGNLLLPSQYRYYFVLAVFCASAAESSSIPQTETIDGVPALCSSSNPPSASSSTQDRTSTQSPSSPLTILNHGNINLRDVRDASMLYTTLVYNMSTYLPEFILLILNWLSSPSSIAISSSPPLDQASYQSCTTVQSNHLMSHTITQAAGLIRTLCQTIPSPDFNFTQVFSAQRSSICSLFQLPSKNVLREFEQFHDQWQWVCLQLVHFKDAILQLSSVLDLGSDGDTTYHPHTAYLLALLLYRDMIVEQNLTLITQALEFDSPTTEKRFGALLRQGLSEASVEQRSDLILPGSSSLLTTYGGHIHLSTAYNSLTVPIHELQADFTTFIKTCAVDGNTNLNQFKEDNALTLAQLNQYRCYIRDKYSTPAPVPVDSQLFTLFSTITELYQAVSGTSEETTTATSDPNAFNSTPANQQDLNPCWLTDHLVSFHLIVKLQLSSPQSPTDQAYAVIPLSMPKDKTIGDILFQCRDASLSHGDSPLSWKSTPSVISWGAAARGIDSTTSHGTPCPTPIEYQLGQANISLFFLDALCTANCLDISRFQPEFSSLHSEMDDQEVLVTQCINVHLSETHQASNGPEDHHQFKIPPVFRSVAHHTILIDEVLDQSIHKAGNDPTILSGLDTGLEALNISDGDIIYLEVDQNYS